MIAAHPNQRANFIERAVVAFVAERSNPREGVRFIAFDKRSVDI
jgi:hypothetical protein